jgi:hypothetical protein
MALGVTHGRRHIAVDRAEVALAVDQHQAHRERLGHADQGEVDRGVTVRVILTHHVTDHAGRLHIGTFRRLPLFVHREQYPTVHGFQAVARVGQGAADDDAHRIVEIGAAELVLDVDRGDIPARSVARDRGVFVAQGDFSPSESDTEQS